MSSRLIGKSSDFDSEDSWFEPRGDNIEIKIENSAHPTITCIQGLMGVFWKSNCSGLQPRLENGRYFDRYGDRHLRLPLNQYRMNDTSPQSSKGVRVLIFYLGVAQFGRARHLGC